MSPNFETSLRYEIDRDLFLKSRFEFRRPSTYGRIIPKKLYVDLGLDSLSRSLWFLYTEK